jgi:NAD(P)-dependent dehydrogenase (short-subunit alcohol dehydrogenase family)
MSALKNKVALVTGASRGIGYAAAQRLARDGAIVIAHYSASKAGVDALIESITQAGGRAYAVQANLAERGSAATLFKAVDAVLARENLKGIDILVNNAGIAPWTTLADTDEATFDEIFAVNVRAPFFLAKEAATRLNDGGRIINLSSVVARAYFAGIPAYSASKGAINTLTIHLAAEFASRNITVNAVAPGAIETDMSAWLRSPDGEKAALSMQALQRKGQAEDIANVIAFVAGPDSAWTTGQIIEASGGTKL